MNTVYPVGYSASGARKRLEQLIEGNPRLLLIDVRLSPRSRLPYWRGDSLKARFGSRYQWAGSFLGNVNYKTGGPIQLVDPAAGVYGLCRYLDEGYDLVLLCGCRDYARCHRKTVVDLLRQVRPETCVKVEEVSE